MSSIEDIAAKTISAQKEIDKAIRGILEKHFEMTSEKMQENPGYMAYAGFAVEVGVSLANMIIAAKKPESGRSFRAMSDLVYGLNANDFWVKNAAVLVPIITVVLNSHRDWIGLMLERRTLGEYSGYDKLIGSTKIVPLELFSMLLYLVGGPVLMATASLPLKLDLAPYFLD